MNVNDLMVFERATQARMEELNRCKDLVWSTLEEQNQNGSTRSEESNPVLLANEASQARFESLIHAGQNVFITGGQSIGKVMSLLPGAEGRISHLDIRTGHLWGRHKRLPVDLISDITPKAVCLSIGRNQFNDLPDYKTDAALTNEIENALWNDQVLRVTSYHEVDLQVKDGVVSFTGHVASMMGQNRIEAAVGNVKDILGVKMHLIADDKLLLRVAGALVLIEHVEGNHVFAQVENGVVVLSGTAVSADVRGLAQQYTSEVPGVRGVINNIAAPGINLAAEDQRFLQPSINEEIFFHDGLFGFVKQVIIEQNSRRVVAMIVQGQFPNRQKSGSLPAEESLPLERLAVIPVSVIRYLTSISGFLLIDSTETTRYQDFDPAKLVAPDIDWVPPYPYCIDNVMFYAEK